MKWFQTLINYKVNKRIYMAPWLTVLICKINLYNNSIRSSNVFIK